MTVGERYDRYVIRRLLGRGSMGEVYLALDTDFNREVAIKLVYNGPDADDRDILEAERLGAELQKRLAGVDPRVVIVHQYGEMNGDLLIEMEYIEGEDLSALLARAPLSPEHAAHIATELCEMLENLQSFNTVIDDKRFAGIVHGDLKPKNIRVATSGQIKVLDFGIAKALSHTRKHTVNLFASAAYCSPERLETQNMNLQSDLWSVGVLLYQMIAARLPFDDTSRERLERRIRSYQPPDPLPPECPEPLSHIAFKMLARDPARRYPSAAEARADLMRWRDGQPIAAPAFESEATVRTSATPPDADFQDSTVRTVPPLPPLPPAPRRGLLHGPFPRPLMGCFAVFLGVVVLGIIFAFMQLDVWRKSESLKTDLATEHVSDEDAWGRYQNLQSRIHFPGLLWPARTSLKKHLATAADATLLEYRNSDAPQIYLKQWTRARTALLRALDIDPDDRELRGKLLVCEGQIDRILAGSLKGDARQKRLNTAVARFREGAGLLRNTPDAELGLARIYTYDLNDLEQAEEALAKAADKGHPAGKREQAQLADGYRRRGDRIWRESRAFQKFPDREQESLEKARQDYMKAQELYQKTELFGDAARNEMLALDGQHRVEQRLDQLRAPAAPAVPQ